ncbi:MAG: co-chaperone DjlA [Proteobacteria bacterium]|nr:co-chaperone DjlA [Pseudomonadota bacterium]
MAGWNKRIYSGQCRMPYWGKVIGTLGGLAIGHPWMAIIGLLVGHLFDRGFADRFTRFGPDVSAARLEQLPQQYLRALFEIMGHLAKVDGRVTEDEIRAARALMHRLGLGPTEIRRAINWFERGKEVSYPLISTLRSMRGQSARRADMRGLFVRLLMEVALSKSSLQQTERATIWTICKELDIGRVELAQLEAMLRAQRGFRRSVAGAADGKRVNDAYVALGIDRSSSNDEIKKAYRRLMNKNHPDKLAARGLPESMRPVAEERSRELNSAYDIIKRARPDVR